MKLYPLQFEPILKERIWGGEKLKTILNKPITSKITGESWEISTVEGDVSVVAIGILAGKSLNDLINSNPDALLGTDLENNFPYFSNILMLVKICRYKCIPMMN
jgi:mannose-6-phosphate isomerase